MANILHRLVYAYREDNTRFREAPVWRWFCLELCAASGMMESRGLAVRQNYIVHICACMRVCVRACVYYYCFPLHQCHGKEKKMVFVCRRSALN